MGAMAEGLVAYAQPLLDQTDGSEEQLNKAFAIGQLCYNLALMPEDRRASVLTEVRRTLEMDNEKFEVFQQCVVLPMIQRHQEMFPQLHRRVDHDPPRSSPSLPEYKKAVTRAERFPGADRYAPCPCNSGEKYKFCCGARGR